MLVLKPGKKRCLAFDVLICAFVVCLFVCEIGGVSSLISLPCFMSHASIPAHIRAERGLFEDLIRISVSAPGLLFAAFFSINFGVLLEIDQNCRNFEKTTRHLSRSNPLPLFNEGDCYETCFNLHL